MTTTFATTAEPLLSGAGDQIAGINDLYIGADGNLAVATGLAAVMQACASAARTLLGECVLQTDVGLPNFQLIWVGVPNVPQWQAALRFTLQAVEGVDSIVSINAIRASKNVLQYTAVIKTIYGQGVLNG